MADAFNHAIRKIVLATGVVTTLAGSGGERGRVDGVGTVARFSTPDGLATDGMHLYVADSGNGFIRKVDIRTGDVTTLPGSNRRPAGGTGGGPRFINPLGIALCGEHLCISDSRSSVIRRVALRDGAVSALAVHAEGVRSTARTSVRLSEPSGVAMVGTELFVADSRNHAIRKVELRTGEVTNLAGRAGESGSADGTGAAARFRHPFGIATDGKNLYVTDMDNHTIRKIVITTGAVTTLAGSAGSKGSADGKGSAARFDDPAGIAIDGRALYVADHANNTIRKVAIRTAAVTTLAGSAGESGSANGTGAAARFNEPIGIATDGRNLYVAERGNHTIRKIAIRTGEVTTLAGSAGEYGFKDGIGSGARFSGPLGVAIHGNVLYVADAYNGAIRQVSVVDGKVTNLAGGPAKESSLDGKWWQAGFLSPAGIAASGGGFPLYVTTGDGRIRKIY